MWMIFSRHFLVVNIGRMFGAFLLSRQVEFYVHTPDVVFEFLRLSLVAVPIGEVHKLGTPGGVEDIPNGAAQACAFEITVLKVPDRLDVTEGIERLRRPRLFLVR